MDKGKLTMLNKLCGVLLGLMAASAVMAAPISAQLFHLNYPDSWTLAPREKGMNDECYRLSSPDKTNLEEYTLEICVVAESLKDAITSTGIFIKNDAGKWIAAAGRGDPKAAAPFNRNDWQGIRAIVECGVNDKEGHYHAAAGRCLWVVISNGKTSLVFNTVGLTKHFDTIDQIINSTRFH
jgi:hypothetical protein